MSQISEDGYWLLLDGQWVPSEKQKMAIQNGAQSHDEEHGNVENTNPAKNNGFSERFSVQKNNEIVKGGRNKWLVIGSGATAVVIASIVMLSLLSPGAISALDEFRDSDGDGITDYDELEQGTDPLLSDTDNDGLSDDNDDCPAGGQENWESNLVSDFDGDGCRDDIEDEDDDNDGILDFDDGCDTSVVGWISTFDTDNDGDGCHDDGDADDDNDGWSDVKEAQCSTNPLNSASRPADYDNDNICNLVDSDDDNDGVDDDQDLFPYDADDWADFDGDGIGDNSDDDDDGDGIMDIDDANDFADVGIILTFDYFELYTNMDYLDSTTELYACIFIETINSGCGPDNEGQYWNIQTYTSYSLGTEFYADIDDQLQTNLIQVCAWDSDYSEDDRIDINPNSANNCYNLNFNTSSEVGYSETLVASGLGDGVGYDGEMTFSYSVIDLRAQRFNQFDWDFQGSDYSLTYNFDYNDYSTFKNMDHTVDYYDISTYARFATPDEQYVVSFANTLENMAIQNGFTSDLDKAEFIYAFVGDIQYVLDIEGSNVSEYPKYPIEMLWEASGDCEDAAILYISLIEALGYDAMLATGLVKSDSDDDWGGHAWALVNIPGESGLGTYYWGLDDESNTKFYFVEATGHYDGYSYIGRNPWYDIDDVTLFDVE